MSNSRHKMVQSAESNESTDRLMHMRQLRDSEGTLNRDQTPSSDLQHVTMRLDDSLALKTGLQVFGSNLTQMERLIEDNKQIKNRMSDVVENVRAASLERSLLRSPVNEPDHSLLKLSEENQQLFEELSKLQAKSKRLARSPGGEPSRDPPEASRWAGAESRAQVAGELRQSDLKRALQQRDIAIDAGRRERREHAKAKERIAELQAQVQRLTAELERAPPAVWARAQQNYTDNERVRSVSPVTGKPSQPRERGRSPQLQASLGRVQRAVQEARRPGVEDSLERLRADLLLKLQQGENEREALQRRCEELEGHKSVDPKGSSREDKIRPHSFRNREIAPALRLIFRPSSRGTENPETFRREEEKLKRNLAISDGLVARLRGEADERERRISEIASLLASAAPELPIPADPNFDRLEFIRAIASRLISPHPAPPAQSPPERSELHEQLAQTAAERSQLERDAQAYLEEIGELESKLDSLVHENNSLKNRLSLELDFRNSKVRSLEETIAQLKSSQNTTELDSVNEKVSKLEWELLQAVDQAKKSEHSIASLQDKLQAEQKRSQGLLEQIEDLHSALEQNQNQVSEQLLAEIEAKSGQILKLSAQISDFKARETQAVAESQKESLQRKQEVEELNFRLKKISEEKANLAKDLDLKYANDIASLKVEINSLLQQINELHSYKEAQTHQETNQKVQEEKISQLNSQIVSLRTAIESSKQKEESLLAQIEASQTKAKSLESALSEQKQTSESQVKIYEKQMKEMNDQLVSVRAVKDRTETETKDHFTRQLEQATKEFENSTALLEAQLSSKNEELFEIEQKSSQEKTLLEEKVRQLEKEISSEKEEERQLKASLALIKMQAKTLQEQVSKATEAKDRAIEDSQKAQAKIVELQSELKTKTEAAQKELEDARNSFLSQVEEQSTKTAQLVRQIEKISAEKSSLSKDFDSQVQLKNAELASQITQLSSQLQVEQSKVKELDDLRAKVEALEQTKKGYEETLKQKTATESDLMMKLSDLGTKLIVLERQKNSAVEETDKLKAEFEQKAKHLETQNSTLKEEAKQARQELEEVNALAKKEDEEREILEDSIRELEKELAEARETREILIKDFESFSKEQKEKFEKELARIRSEDSSKVQLQQANERASAFEKMVVDLNHKLFSAVQVGKNSPARISSLVDQKIQELNTKVAKLSQKMEETRQRVKVEALNRSEKAKEDEEKKYSSIANLSKELDGSRKEIEQLNRSLKEKVDEISSLKAEISTRAEEASKGQPVDEVMTSQIAEEIGKKYREELYEKTILLGELKAQLESLQARYSKELEENQRKTQEFSAKVESLQANHHDELLGMSEKIAQLTQQIGLIEGKAEEKKADVLEPSKGHKSQEETRKGEGHGSDLKLEVVKPQTRDEGSKISGLGGENTQTNSLVRPRGQEETAVQTESLEASESELFDPVADLERAFSLALQTLQLVETRLYDAVSSLGIEAGHLAPDSELQAMIDLSLSQNASPEDSPLRAVANVSHSLGLQITALRAALPSTPATDASLCASKVAAARAKLLEADALLSETHKLAGDSLHSHPKSSEVLGLHEDMRGLRESIALMITQLQSNSLTSKELEATNKELQKKLEAASKDMKELRSAFSKTLTIKDFETEQKVKALEAEIARLQAEKSSS